MGPDPTYTGQTKIYFKSYVNPASFNGNSVTTEEVADVGSLLNVYGCQALNGQILPAKITFSKAPQGAGGSNKCRVTVTVCDNGGNAIQGLPFDVDICLSDSTQGIGLTGTTPSGGVAVATGTLLATFTTGKAFLIQSDGTGTVQVDITDAGKTAYCLAVQGGGLPLPYVSLPLQPADYS